MKYTISVTGLADDKSKQFATKVDISVSNGGNFKNVGEAVQSAIDKMYAEAQNVEVTPDAKSDDTK